MYSFNCSVYRRFFFIIFIPWIFGLVLGSLLLAWTPSESLLMMRSFPNVRVSIVGSVCSLVLPVAVSALILRYSSVYFIAPFLLLKAALFSYCSCCILSAFESAGWLLWILLLFSDVLGVLVLFWFLDRHILASRGVLYKDFLTAVILLFGIALLDHLLISPFILFLYDF